MISLLVEILLICAIIVVASYILDNLIIALVVCSAIVVFFSRKSKKKVVKKQQPHDICKSNLKRLLKETDPSEEELNAVKFAAMECGYCETCIAEDLKECPIYLKKEESNDTKN